MQAVSSTEVSPGDWSDRPGGRIRITRYFGGRSDPNVVLDGPQGSLIEYDSPGAVVQPHFHSVRQFQVIVQGERLGKKPLAPFSFHYVDANTPYGPIVGNGTGLIFFTLRPEQSTAVHYMPVSRDKLPGKAGRNFVGHFSLADTTATQQAAAFKILLEPTEDGLQAASIHLGPNAESDGLLCKGGGGQYYLVAAGSLIHEGKDLPKLSLVWLDPDESAPVLHAGPTGADVLVMQFPVKHVPK